MRSTCAAMMLLAATAAVKAQEVRPEDIPTAFKFYTKTDITLCLATSSDPNATPVTVTTDQMKDAMLQEFNAESYRMSDPQGGVSLVEGSPSCKATMGDTFVGDQFHIEIFNEPTGTLSAGEVSSRQVDQVYGGVSDFTGRTADSVGASRDLMFMTSLGFVVVFPDQEVDALATPLGATTSGIQSLGGTDVYWPWWAWLLYAGLLVLCFIPLCVCVIRKRKVEEEEEEEDLAVAKVRMEEGLHKIYGPEWGMTEVDFDGEPDAADDAMAIHLGEETKKISYNYGPQIPNERIPVNASEAAWEAEVGQGGVSDKRSRLGAQSRFDIDEELGADDIDRDSFDLARTQRVNQ